MKATDRILCALRIHDGVWSEPAKVDGWLRGVPVEFMIQIRECDHCGAAQQRRVRGVMEVKA
jgi:hypothetical protein